MMAQIWHKLFSFGANFSHLAKVMAQEKKILVGTLKSARELMVYKVF